MTSCIEGLTPDDAAEKLYRTAMFYQRETSKLRREIMDISRHDKTTIIVAGMLQDVVETSLADCLRARRLGYPQKDHA